MERARELQEEISKLNSMISTVGWQEHQEWIKNQLTQRVDTLVLNPLTAMDQVLAEQYAKGEISGMRLTMMFPEIRIRELTDELNELLRESEAESGSSDAEFDPDYPAI